MNPYSRSLQSHDLWQLEQVKEEATQLEKDNALHTICDYQNTMRFAREDEMDIASFRNRLPNLGSLFSYFVVFNCFLLDSVFML